MSMLGGGEGVGQGGGREGGRWNTMNSKMTTNHFTTWLQSLENTKQNYM